jgi:hypothetical protein
VWKLKEVHQCVKNHWTFANNIVRRKKLKDHPPEHVPRILQTLAITVLYQLVGFAFKNKLDVLQSRVSNYNAKMQKKKGTKLNTQLFKMFHTMKDSFFGSFVAKSRDAPAGYQKLFGYNWYVKLLIMKATKVTHLECHTGSQEDKDDRKPAAKLSKNKQTEKPAAKEPKYQTEKPLVDGKYKVLELSQAGFYEHHPGQMVILNQTELGYLNVMERLLDKKLNEKLDEKIDAKLALQDERQMKKASGFSPY